MIQGSAVVLLKVCTGSKLNRGGVLVASALVASSTSDSNSSGLAGLLRLILAPCSLAKCTRLRPVTTLPPPLPNERQRSSLNSRLL